MRARFWVGVVALAAIGGVFAGRRTASRDGVATTELAVPIEGKAANLEVDLYAPAKNTTNTLLVFLQGNEPREPDERHVYAASVGQMFQRRGVDTAAIDFRVGPDQPLLKCAESIARVISELDAKRSYGRIVLAGRGVGAWMAAMLGLSTDIFLRGAGRTRPIAGVIAMRGRYVHSAAESPANFAHNTSPPFLLLSAGNDDPEFARNDRDFAQAIAREGVNVERHVVPYRDQHSLTHWGGEANDLGDIVADFVIRGATKLEPDAGVLELQQRWDAHPPLDLADLRADASRITRQPADAALKKSLDLLFARYFPYVLHTLPGKTYESIDLVTWLASQPESAVGKGDHLTITNRRGEQLYFTRAELHAAKPVIVVGIDDETNLYRLFGYYRLKHDYSWKKGQQPMPLMIRPLGAFLHFPNEAPRPDSTYARFTLTAKSFRWSETDPLAPLADLSPTLQPTLTGDQGCVKCHSFRGAGARAHHLLSSNGESYGAFALPLEEYPPDVLRRFLYEQDAVARGFDVTPLMVPKPAADELFALASARR